MPEVLSTLPSWATALAAVIAALLLYAGTRFTAKGGVKAAHISSSGPDWNNFAGRLEARLDAVERENEKLRGRLDRMSDELRVLSRSFKDAVAYVERLLDWIADHPSQGGAVPPIPAGLHEHLSPSVVESWRTPPPAKPEGG